MFSDSVRNYVRVSLIVFVAVAVVGCAALHPSGTDPQQMSPFDFILSTVWFVLLGVFVYFMLVLQPRFAKEDTHKKFLETLKKQDEVVTTGGLFARVVAVRPEFVTLEIAPNVRVKVKPADVHAPPAPPKVSSPSDQSQAEQRS